jgi:hypothetical protein
LLLDRLLRRERGCTSHRLLHWLSLCINLWRELLLHRLLVLGLLLTCTIHLPAVDGVEVTLLSLTTVYIQMGSELFTHLNIHLLDLVLSEDTETHTAGILARLMAQHIFLGKPRLTRSLTDSLLCRKNCGNLTAQNNFTHNLEIFNLFNKFIVINIRKIVV